MSRDNFIFGYSLYFAFILLMLFFVIMISGCAVKDEPLLTIKKETQEVYIPVPCKVEMPLKQEGNNTLESVKNMAIYAESLEQLLIYCKGGRLE